MILCRAGAILTKGHCGSKVETAIAVAEDESIACLANVITPLYRGEERSRAAPSPLTKGGFAAFPFVVKKRLANEPQRTTIH